MANRNPMGVMLNAYPDSIGGTLGDIVAVLKRPELKNAFTSFYILPSIFNTDLDRGFSLIDYGLNRLLSSPEDLDDLRAMDVDLPSGRSPAAPPPGPSDRWRRSI